MSNKTVTILKSDLLLLKIWLYILTLITVVSISISLANIGRMEDLESVPCPRFSEGYRK